MGSDTIIRIPIRPSQMDRNPSARSLSDPIGLCRVPCCSAMLRSFKGATRTGSTASAVRPVNIDQLIGIVQREFPLASIRITGRARTIRRQAELMAQRIRANRREFLSTYRPATHISEMGQWHLQNRTATERATVDEFERIIQRAAARGVMVSNHLSNTARDISWPHGTNQQLDVIEARIRAMGASVIREPNAAGGRHWHVDW